MRSGRSATSIFRPISSMNARPLRARSGVATQPTATRHSSNDKYARELRIIEGRHDGPGRGEDSILDFDKARKKRKLPPTRSARSRTGVSLIVLPRATPSHAKGNRLAKAQGRSPDSASQTRFDLKARLAADCLPGPETSGAAVGGFWKQYSGGTVRDSHPLPYSPLVRGTQSLPERFKDQCSRPANLTR